MNGRNADGVSAYKAQTTEAVGAAARVSELFAAESLSLLGYFLRRVDNRDDAADLVGETALVLWRRCADLPDDPEQARMWMYGIARRALSTHRRGKGRRLALADRLRRELASVEVEEATDSRVDDLRAEVGRLSARDQELIGLLHWEGFSIGQAATMIGISAGAAQMRYQRARTRLRSILGD